MSSPHPLIPLALERQAQAAEPGVTKEVVIPKVGVGGVECKVMRGFCDLSLCVFVIACFLFVWSFRLFGS